MSDKPAPEPAKKLGWLKPLLGTAAGLLSGAVMMYLSPLLDKVVKPARPLANFAVEHEGLTVTFHNRSAGGGDGWWDFGDGSPLEPLPADGAPTTHAYRAPGSYTAKLTLRNFLGEESERSVTVQVDPPRTGAPTIASLEATPVSPGAYAPATYRVRGKVQGAQVCVWDLGDDRPLEILTEGLDSQDRLVTFREPGAYVIRLAAVNGLQAVQKSEIVNVEVPPAGTVTALLTVADQATRVETVETSIPVSIALTPTAKDKTAALDRRLQARQGFAITAARLEPVADPNVKDLRLEVAADRRSVRLTGQLIRDSSRLSIRGAAPVSRVVRVHLTQERRTPITRPTVPVAATLSVPGSALLSLPPLPGDWVEPQRQLRLELRDGDRVIWREAPLPRGAIVTLQGRRCTLTAVPAGNQVRVDLADAPRP
jgi:PKD repeat protein